MSVGEIRSPRLNPEFRSAGEKMRSLPVSNYSRSINSKRIAHAHKSTGGASIQAEAKMGVDLMIGLDVLDRSKMRHLKGRSMRILRKETGIFRKSGGSGREAASHHGKRLPLHFTARTIDN